MARFIAAIPKIVVAILLTAAIINLLIGVFLRYVMIPVTDWLDMDSIPFTWVEEVGEMLLAWLTLVGALSVLYASCAVGGALLVVYALSMIVNPPPQSSDGAH